MNDGRDLFIMKHLNDVLNLELDMAPAEEVGDLAEVVYDSLFRPDTPESFRQVFLESRARIDQLEQGIRDYINLLDHQEHKPFCRPCETCLDGDEKLRSLL